MRLRISHVSGLEGLLPCRLDMDGSFETWQYLKSRISLSERSLFHSRQDNSSVEAKRIQSVRIVLDNGVERATFVLSLP